jgi:hypothetical protein
VEKIFFKPLISKDFQTMDTLSKTPSRPQARQSGPNGIFPPNLRLSGHFLSLASNIGALEECLALERASAGYGSGHASGSDRGTAGIFSPPAVPYCDFLMLRNFAGELQAVSRLMRLGQDNPMQSALGSDRFQLSPLLTALRYSREGVVEMGAPAFRSDALGSGLDPTQAARLLWQGLIVYMERNGLGFVVGWDMLTGPVAASTASGALTGTATPAPPGKVSRPIPRLMDAHGLHPDLEVESLSKFRRHGPVGSQNRFRIEDASDYGSLPSGLHEALRRGCRLAAEPVLDEATGRWEFVWVSFRDMLDRSPL